MKISVFSDSHGDKNTMRQVIERLEPDAVIYLGDGVNDIFAFENEFVNIRFEYVKGNCDTFANAPKEKLISIGGFTFIITHGDMFMDSLETDRIIEYAREKGASLFLHGHTHHPTLWTQDGITVMNPGSVRNKPGKGYPSCGFIKTYETHFTCKILFPAEYAG